MFNTHILGGVFISTEKFFNILFGSNHVHFRCLKKSHHPIDANGFITNQIKQILLQANEQNFEVYFVANVGGYKNEHIREFVTVFLDLDCGRDEEGSYYPIEVVEAYKDKKLQELRSHTIPPTAIIETRNGYQSMWALEAGATSEQFHECQKRLIAQFEGDKSVKKPCNLLRVPYFMWCKNPNEKYPITLVELNERRHDIDTIISSLPEVKKREDKRDNNKKKYNTLLYIDVTDIPQHDQLEWIRDRDIKKLHSIIHPTPTKFHHHDQVYDHLKRQNLAHLLGVSGSQFQCIFHKDRNPSAGIFINEESGHFIYKCHSSNCSFGSGTIIKCIERLLRCSRTEALRFLRKLYLIDYHETEWQREQKELLDENRRYLYSDEFELEYPNLYRLIIKYLPQLNALLGFARDYVVTENFATPDQSQSVFFASTRYLARRCKIGSKTSSIRFNIFAFLGLLYKLPDDEVPETMRNQAIAIAKQNNYPMRVNFYSFPSFSESILTQADVLAKEFKDRRMTVRGWSREMLLRTFGHDVADRVFPQMKGKPIPALNQNIADQLEQIILRLITDKGWTREKEVLQYAKFVGIRTQFTETQLKRMIPEFLEKYALTKRKLKKEVKSRLGIKDTGYFEIILREE